MVRIVSCLTIAGLALSLLVPSADAGGKRRTHDELCIDRQLMDDVNSGRITFANAQKKCGTRLEIVRLSGKVFQFAPNIVPPDATVPQVLVSLAEFPFTRYLDIRTDDDGTWALPVIKFRGIPLEVSLRFEKEGFVTSKSNLLTIEDDAVDSIAMQFTDEIYYTAAIQQLGAQVSAAIGIPYSVQSLTVCTVGKSWASSFLNVFPHGDPGATVTADPSIAFPALGPIYFNDVVAPDPSQPYTSIDGGVLFANLPAGRCTLNAAKAPYDYSPVTFTVEAGVHLYIASPPHSLQGTNPSEPGEW